MVAPEPRARLLVPHFLRLPLLRGLCHHIRSAMNNNTTTQRNSADIALVGVPLADDPVKSVGDPGSLRTDLLRCADDQRNHQDPTSATKDLHMTPDQRPASSRCPKVPTDEEHQDPASIGSDLEVPPEEKRCHQRHSPSGTDVGNFRKIISSSSLSLSAKPVPMMMTEVSGTSSSSSSSSLSLTSSQRRRSHHFPPSVGYRLGQRKVLFERRKRVSDYALVCALLGVLGMVFETEMTMAHVYEKNSLSSLSVKTVISLSTMLLLVLIIAYHGIQTKLFVVDNCVDDWRIAVSWSVIVQLSAELVICSIHPFPVTAHFTWTTLHADGEKVTSVLVPVDLVLSLPMFLRFYLVGRVMLLRSRLFSDATSRSIGALNRINFNTRFVLKTLMTICPGSVLVLFMLSLWILASWTLRACESYHELKHRNLLNSLWMVAITFLCVGYGDIVPNTYCGRAVAVFTGIMGSGCTALVVAVLARKLELTRAEKHVHNFMMDNQLTKKLKNTAANVLRETWLIYKHTKLVKKVRPGQVRSHQRRFLQAIRSLRNVKMDQRKLNDSANTLVDVAKHFIHSALDPTQTAYISQPPALYRQTQMNLFDVIVDMNCKQRNVERRADRIEEHLRCLQEQLDMLPQLVADALSSVSS